MSYLTLALFPMCYILSLSLSYLLLLPWCLPPLSTFLLGVYTLSICRCLCVFLALGTAHHNTASVPLVLLMSAASIVCRPTSSTTTTGPIFLHVEHLAIGVHTHRCTRVVLLYKEHRL